jgi:protein-L-isoaspartate(D-aspartate) O-methyltransferase
LSLRGGDFINRENEVKAGRDSQAREPLSRDFIMQDFHAARLNMVESQLRVNAVIDLDILAAFVETPRELFVPEARRSLAYMDECVKIADAAGPQKRPRYLMEPRVFGKMLTLANVQPSDHVLDVGCGLGYSSAVLARLAERVVALECDDMFSGKCAESFQQLGLSNIQVQIANDLTQGYAKLAPYDVILLNGSVSRVPDALLSQLKEGGRLVAVINKGVGAQAHLFIRADGKTSGRPGFDANIRALPGFELEESFTF